MRCDVLIGGGGHAGGGGYIGLEGASALVKQGKHVVLIEARDRVLARVAGTALSRSYEAEHRAHGVELRLDSAVDCPPGAEGRVMAARLADGEVIPCDLVIVGGGVVPAIEPLAAVGADAGNGVRDFVQGRALVVDGASIDPDILINPPIPLGEARIREHELR